VALTEFELGKTGCCGAAIRVEGLRKLYYPYLAFKDGGGGVDALHEKRLTPAAKLGGTQSLLQKGIKMQGIVATSSGSEKKSIPSVTKRCYGFGNLPPGSDRGRVENDG